MMRIFHLYKNRDCIHPSTWKKKKANKICETFSIHQVKDSDPWGKHKWDEFYYCPSSLPRISRFLRREGLHRKRLADSVGGKNSWKFRKTKMTRGKKGKSTSEKIPQNCGGFVSSIKTSTHWYVNVRDSQGPWKNTWNN